MKLPRASFFIPIYAKILLWFLVNLALLAAGFYFFVGGQLDIGGALLSGSTGDRIRALSEVLAAEIRDAERDEWDEILSRYSSENSVELTLAGERGEPIAGQADVVFPAPIFPVTAICCNVLKWS